MYNLRSNHPSMEDKLAVISPHRELDDVFSKLFIILKLVPQKDYKPQAPFDRRVLASFYEGDRLGISLEDALRDYNGLIGKDQYAFDENLRSVKMSLRVLWPDYEAYGPQITVQDSRQPRRPITLGKLAKIIAQRMEQAFFKTHGLRTAESDGEWQLGPDHITLKNIYLMEVVQVAQASIQPVFAVRV